MDWEFIWNIFPFIAMGIVFGGAGLVLILEDVWEFFKRHF